MSKTEGKKGSSFKAKLGSEELKFFNEVAAQPFSGQAVAFLNAYWLEIGPVNAEWIFNVAWEQMKQTDMHYKGVQYVHKYKEGINLDFDAGLYFFEHLCKYMDDQKNEYADADRYSMCVPTMMTAIKRKKELKNKVDVNFDGRVSFLEYLLYQFQDHCSPEDFCERSMNFGDEPEEVRLARLALEAANEAIRAYEAEKFRLTELAKKKNVKGRTAKNELAQLESSPVAEGLQVALITAGAALRKAQKKFKIRGSSGGTTTGGKCAANTSSGAMFWMQTELNANKAKYGGGSKKNKGR